MTLWPISMFSMILATPKVTVPAHHAQRREVADVAFEQPDHARLTDAHPAAEWHLDADALAGLHQGCRPVHGERLLTACERHRAAMAVRPGFRRREALEVEPVSDAARMPNLL